MCYVGEQLLFDEESLYPEGNRKTIPFSFNRSDNRKTIKNKIIDTCYKLNVSLIATCDNYSLNDYFLIFY